MVVRGEDGQFQLFVFDRYTVKPRTVTTGATVRVSSVPGDEPGVRIARQVTVTEAAPAQRPRAAAEEPVVPVEIRRIERDIERQVRRYQVGVRTGVALDPEVVLLGVHAQVGPFFVPDVYFRPNVEFGFGEVTTLFALNPEVIYRLPISSRQGRWSTYVGAGPGFTFLHQNFERRSGEGRNIDFGDFSSDVGFNILGGLRYRTGMFMELKASIYSRPAPVMRFILGYNF
ncbi:MAG TPA: hypothetical protein VN428_16995 [Bryobacteraceae bacterium]|nr:hypothetical protein [Bryobacteraceae bacterium]